jgi:Fe-S oxidoreductase
VHTIPTPREDRFWERDALVAEEKRVFEICNGCRLCWNLCPSFPRLFEAVAALDTSTAPAAEPTEKPEGEHALETRADVMGQAEALERLDLSVHQQVVDLCYQCKLCDPICPYQPPHEFAVDFPRLMLRHKAVDARKHGVALGDRLLGDPDLVGKVGTTFAPLSNLANDVPLNRIAMEGILGVHRNRKLPKFADETFRSWFRQTHPDQKPPGEVAGKKVVLFYTCSVQWNEPAVGRAAVKVLERNGVTVYAPELRCCGMPALDGGDVPRATAWAKQNIDVLLPYVDAGCEVVSPGPTCSYMIRKEWADYVGTPEAERVAAHAHDLMAWIYGLLKKGELDTAFQKEMGAIGYHVPCHLKVQKIGFRSRDVLKQIPGTTVHLVDRCSCMDGTWGMKKEYYELSKQGAQRLLDDLTKAAPQRLSSDCLIAKLQIEEGTGKEVHHPIEILWDAYGGD